MCDDGRELYACVEENMATGIFMCGCMKKIRLQSKEGIAYTGAAFSESRGSYITENCLQYTG
jgi:hypothetical protein